MTDKKTIEMTAEEFQEHFQETGERLKELKKIKQQFEEDGIIKSDDEVKDSIL